MIHLTIQQRFLPTFFLLKLLAVFSYLLHQASWKSGLHCPSTPSWKMCSMPIATWPLQLLKLLSPKSVMTPIYQIQWPLLIPLQHPWHVTCLCTLLINSSDCLYVYLPPFIISHICPLNAGSSSAYPLLLVSALDQCFSAWMHIRINCGILAKYKPRLNLIKYIPIKSDFDPI